MKVIDAVNESIQNYPSLYLSDDYEASKFMVLHHYFIVLGNGIKWANTKDPKKGGYLTHPKYRKLNGEWVRKRDLPYRKEKLQLDPRFFTEKVYEVGDPTIGGFLNKYNYIDSKKGGEKVIFESQLNKDFDNYVKHYTEPYDPAAKFVIDEVTIKKHEDVFKMYPYPNFDKKYSCFWEIEPNLIQEDWRTEGLSHIKHWQLYFNDPEKVKNYNYYPNLENIEELRKYILKSHGIKPNESKQQFVDRINKDYITTVFNGDNWLEFANERWLLNHGQIIQFISETIDRLEF